MPRKSIPDQIYIYILIKLDNNGHDVISKVIRFEVSSDTNIFIIYNEILNPR